MFPFTFSLFSYSFYKLDQQQLCDLNRIVNIDDINGECVTALVRQLYPECLDEKVFQEVMLDNYKKLYLQDVMQEIQHSSAKEQEAHLKSFQVA